MRFLKRTNMLTTVFWALVGMFIVILCQFFIPAFTELLRGPVFLVPFIIFSLFGGMLIFSTIKERVKGMLKKFLLLTGASAAGFFVGVFLHNAFYALAVITKHITVLKRLMEVLHIVFFFLAIPICPLGFLVGVTGSIILFIKKRKREQ